MSVGTSILTDAGLQALINAHAQGTKVKPKYYKVTDQNISLDPSLTDIPNAWRTADIDGYVQVDENTVEFLIVIPTEAASKYGRTFGLFLEDGTLFLVAKPPYPFPPGLRQTFKVQLYFEKADEVLDFQYIPFDETEQSLSVYDATTLHDVVAEMQDEINLLHQARIDYYSFKQTQGSKIGKHAEWADNAVNSYYAEVAENAKMVGGFPEAALAKRSTKAITIYVNADRGSDTEGDGTQKKPFKTFAKALSLVPEFYNHNITIVLQKATNSYGNLNISGRIRKNISSTLTITGEMIVLRSGKVVSHSNAVDDPVYGSSVRVAKITTNKTFQTDQYKHKLLRVYKGRTSYYRIITNNDTNSIYCSYIFPVTFDETWQWEILDWGTKCYFVNLIGNVSSVTVQFMSIEPIANYNTITVNSVNNVNLQMCRTVCHSSQSGVNNIWVSNCPAFNIISCYMNLNNRSVYALNCGVNVNINITGSIFDNCIYNYSIYAWHAIAKLGINHGSRFYKGTANPQYLAFLVGANSIMWFNETYGKVVINAGATAGIRSLSGSVVTGLVQVYFGSNVGVPVESNVGFVETDSIVGASYLTVNETDQRNRHSRFICKGSIATQVTTVTANTTLGTDHHIVLVNASGGNRTITLPNASGITGRQYIIKKIDSSANTVTISAQSGQTIDGQASVVLNTQYQFIKIVSDGQNWFKIG